MNAADKGRPRGPARDPFEALHEEGRMANTLKTKLSKLFEDPPPAAILSAEFVRFLLGLAADLASDASVKRLKRCEQRLDSFCGLEFVPLAPEKFGRQQLTDEERKLARTRKAEIIAGVGRDISRKPGQRTRALEVTAWYLAALIPFERYWASGDTRREQVVTEIAEILCDRQLEKHEIRGILTDRSGRLRRPELAARELAALRFNPSLDPKSVARTVRAVRRERMK
jgi:hypothetical protein